MLHFRSSTSFDGITGKSVREILADTLTGSQKAQAMLNKAYESKPTGKASCNTQGEASARTKRNITDSGYKNFLTARAGLKMLFRLRSVHSSRRSQQSLRIMKGVFWA